MNHTLDATNKKVGRIASEAAQLIMGKRSADFAKNEVISITVEVTNASKASIDPRKLRNKTYTRYSGYPGGLTQESIEKTIEKKGYSEVFRKAVYGMLPANKLRRERMKNLIISE